MTMEQNRHIPLSDASETNELMKRIRTLAAHKDMVILGIDGMCGSGKSSLAELLKNQLEPELYIVMIHMDDFFLPPELRSPKRYAEPGGNVHYERFEEEVLAPLSRGEKRLCYRRFDCGRMKYEPEPICVDIPEKSLIIIEGSYSLRPGLREAYDLRLFTCCSSEAQLDRIARRSGKGRLQNFIDRWIPLEDAYFRDCSIRECADLIMDTSFFS